MWPVAAQLPRRTRLSSPRATRTRACSQERCAPIRPSCVLLRCAEAPFDFAVGLPPPRRHPRGGAPGLRPPPRVQGAHWAPRRRGSAPAESVSHCPAQVASSKSAAAKTGKSDKDLTGGAKIMKELKSKRVVKERFSAHKVSVEGRGMIMRD